MSPAYALCPTGCRFEPVVGSTIYITSLDPENAPDVCGVEHGPMNVPLNILEYADE